MKKLTLIISVILFSITIFSQTKIEKAYNKKDFDKCMKLCNKEITKNLKNKQTAYLYKALIFSKDNKKYNIATNYLVKLRASRNFEEFYKNNKDKFHEVQSSIIVNTDTAMNISKNFLVLKKLAKLYLYKFEFTDSKGTADFKTKTSKTSKKDRYIEYKKYRTVLQYALEFKKDIPTFKNAIKSEIELFYIILFNAKPNDDYKPAYNEIYSYLQNQDKKLLPKLEQASIKYAKNDNFKHQVIGNPTTIKRNINYDKVKLRVSSATAEHESSVKKLSEYLTKELNEAEKVYSIYNWVEKNIKYVKDSSSLVSVNAEITQSDYYNKLVRKKQKANYVLKNKKGVCQGFATLFQALCITSGINCEYVSGTAINSNNIIGSHGWNIVEINKAWYLIDVTWRGKKRFLANNLKFNKKHFTQKEMQLLFAPYNKDYFYKNVEKYAKKINSIEKDSTSLFKLAKVYYDKKDYDNAIKTLLNYGKVYKKDFDYYYYIGLSYFKSNSDSTSYKNTITQLKEALKIKPNNVASLNTVAYSYKGLGKFNSAIKYVNLAKKTNYSTIVTYYTEIDILLKIKNYNRAYKIADSLVTNNPKNYENFYYRAKVLYYKEQYDKAIEDLKVYLNKNNGSLSALYYIIQSYYYINKYEEALNYTNKSLSFDMEDDWTLKKKRYLLFLTKDFEGAYKMTKDFYKKDSLNEIKISLLAWYCILTKKYDDAIKYANKRIAINTKTEVWNSLALAYIYTNQYTKAEKIYLEYKDNEFIYTTKEIKTYADFFLKWIKYLEDNNMGHEDFEKVKLILAK